jgi:hypothetical protein
MRIFALSSFDWSPLNVHLFSSFLLDFEKIDSVLRLANVASLEKDDS